MDLHDEFQHPLCTRYASPAMRRLFSARKRIETWRALWIVLAEEQRRLGVSAVTADAIEAMKNAQKNIDFDLAARNEQQVRHDVMAHVHAFGEQAPAARGIIHLGATSCYVTDNADLIIMREALSMLRDKLVSLLDNLARFAAGHRDLPALGRTHLQAAQPTTVGKRAVMWAQDFLMDFQDIRLRLDTLPFRGVKGTTGTQASFLALFRSRKVEEPARCVRELDAAVTARFGFSHALPVTGQTATRKIDTRVLQAVAGIAESAHKMATDIRLLACFKEMDEPRRAEQIGSSAMAYKQNPMRSERVCSIARYVLALASSAPITHAVQWMERTLDDSAVRRMTIPEMFLGADAVLELLLNITAGLRVHPGRIARNLAEELPFMATEDILMECVQAGGDRQELHERIRVHAHAAAQRVKDEGAENDLLERIAADPAFHAVHHRLGDLTDPGRFIGRAPTQVDEFIQRHIDPLRVEYAGALGKTGSVNV